VDAGHTVIDLRDPLSFGASHIPGAFSIGAGTSLSTWASWVVPYDQPILLVASGAGQAEDAARSLVRVGLDDVRGWLEGGFDAWIRAGLALAQTPQWSVGTLAGRLASGRNHVEVIDVRAGDEWNAGHVPGARHIMGGDLPGRIEELRGRDVQYAVICATGYRSTVAASVLERAGIPGVVNVAGGMTAWAQAGLPIE
jgi:hydroxyacylglutathione hydrolase